VIGIIGHIPSVFSKNFCLAVRQQKKTNL